MSIVAAILTVVLGLIGIELWGWLDNLSRAIIWLAAWFLAPSRRAIRRREWVAELYEFRERRLAGVLWALRLLPVAAWERTTETRDAGTTVRPHRDPARDALRTRRSSPVIARVRLASNQVRQVVDTWVATRSFGTRMVGILVGPMLAVSLFALVASGTILRAFGPAGLSVSIVLIVLLTAIGLLCSDRPLRVENHLVPADRVVIHFSLKPFRVEVEALPRADLAAQ